MNLIKLNNNQDNNYGKELTDEEKQQVMKRLSEIQIIFSN